MSEPRIFLIRVDRDEEAGVWYVAESDVPGLATEAESVEAMVEKLRVMVPELLEANGVIGDDDIPTVPFEVLLGRFESQRVLR